MIDVMFTSIQVFPSFGAFLANSIIIAVIRTI